MGKGILDIGNSKCKDFEVDICLTCLRNSEEVIVVGVRSNFYCAVGVVMERLILFGVVGFILSDTGIFLGF